MENELLAIFNHYGQSNQLRKLIEEVLEFYEAVILNDGSIEALKHIEEEYGDIENVMDQFRYALALNYKNIVNSRVYKINRQLERMEDENE